MQQPTLPSASSFDQVAAAYWQDFQQGKPIGGGMVFEQQVRACALDETLESLKRLDITLLALKKILNSTSKDAQKTELQWLQDVDFRRLLLFLGFYAGRVASAMTRRALTWQPATALSIDPPASDEDCFYQAACLCPMGSTSPVFFAWLVLGAKFFGSFRRKFSDPVTQLLMPDSLYWATLGYTQQLGETAVIGAAKPTSAPLSNQKSKLHSKFAEIKQDLRQMPAANNIHGENYAKAASVLERAENLLMQGETLSDKQRQTLTQAQRLLEKLAGEGNTNAMLSLAVCQFEGILTLRDNDAAVAWVEKAAQMNDVRGQKLLSRLYYQGLGVAMSEETGELWLDRAADNGHPEALKLQAQLRQVRKIQSDVRAEANKDRHYIIILVLAGLACLMVLWLLGKLIN